MKINDIITEAPIADYETVGDFDRNSSIRDPRDRKLITNSKTIERVKSKFDATDHNFNLYFVNTPKGGKHTELGEVSVDWVQENLGDEVYEAFNLSNDAITIIFTNNSGAQRVPMTAWIMAHRIGHALVRKNGSNLYGTDNPMARAFRELVSYTSEILRGAFGYDDSSLPMSEVALSRASRPIQLRYKNFWSAIGTFKSAREGSMRDWFEMNNELIAQYITTGSVKFNALPKSFKQGRGNVSQRPYSDIDLEDAEDRLGSLGDMMANNYNRVLSDATGKIFVM